MKPGMRTSAVRLFQQFATLGSPKGREGEGVAPPVYPVGVDDDGAPRLTRRAFVGAATLAAVGCASGRAGSAGSAGEPLPGRGAWELYVGTYTNQTQSRGIYRVLVDARSGALHHVAVAAESSNPSFLAFARGGRTLLAVNELTTFEGSASGTVSAFVRDAATGALTPVARRASRGAAPCYVSVDGVGRHAFVANYVGGSVAVLPIDVDGTLGESTSMVQHTGSGAHPVRQAAPHAHCILVDPAGRHALVADLGIDRILVYRFDAERGVLGAAPVAEVALRPGAGPRHLAFASDGATVYAVNELDSTLVALAYDARRGALRERQLLSTRPAGATGENFPADVHVHPSGRAVYATNRGDDTVAVFSVAPGSGALSLEQVVPTGGRWPRNFGIAPDGRLLLVANQRSDAVVAFRVDPSTGRLTPTGEWFALPSPVCLLFGDAVASPA